MGLRRINLLWILFALQLACAVFFFGDAFFDIVGYPSEFALRQMDQFEFVVSVGLVFSLGFTASELYRLMQAKKRLEMSVRAASGAFQQVLDDAFEAWELTPSEREVALLTIKGMTIAEIAGLRDTKEGTIKAQSTAIYRKARVTNRAQLISYFIEELMGEALVSDANSQAN